jgi:hypothetical protein
MNHNLRMLIGCLLPLLLIFALPLFGVGKDASLFVFIILMFGCHLMMMGGHGKHPHSETDKRINHEQH